MRSGTSKGPYLDLRDLPSDESSRNEILLRIMGSPDLNQIDGIGAASSVASRVVMLKPSDRPNVDVDYLFAQVMIDKPIVDTKPSCGNMMAGVGAFAIEKGWVSAEKDETIVRVYNINTDSYIEIVVQTPEGVVNYVDGNTSIDGVPGQGVPILMNLFNIAGGTTGQLFPTGNRSDLISGFNVSIVDAGNLMMLIKAADLGLEGTEDRAFFEQATELMRTIEATRLEAGQLAGLGDVSDSVLPKVGILSKPRNGGIIKSQYLTPHSLHPSHAVTGAICITAASKAKESVAADVAEVSDAMIDEVLIEHPSGVIPVNIEVSGDGADFTIVKAGTIRTARKLMEGYAYY